ncbi:MAG: 3-oxoacyl-[acyl-carrier-protein] reductase FabG [Turneriella sp.]|nr:3-oxoacyl-[acyl-carrier-protein] reductase FabG [Turneriella sp.]
MSKQTVLITGASSGMGAAIAKVFAVRGFDLLLVARDAQKLHTVKKSLSRWANIQVLICDLTQLNTAQRLFSTLQKKHRQVDILINNAAVGTYGHFVKTNIQRIEAEIATNIRALTELTHLFAAQMQKQKSGKILNVASVAALQAGAQMAVYYASKAYVLHFTEALAEELKNENVQVSVVLPGPLKTDFNTKAGVPSKRGVLARLLRPMSAEKIAQLTVDKFLQGKTMIIPGFINRCLFFAYRFLPRSLPRKMVKRLNAHPIE